MEGLHAKGKKGILPYANYSIDFIQAAVHIVTERPHLCTFHVLAYTSLEQEPLYCTHTVQPLHAFGTGDLLRPMECRSCLQSLDSSEV